jgi:hypothetical protein
MLKNKYIVMFDGGSQRELNKEIMYRRVTDNIVWTSYHHPDITNQGLESILMRVHAQHGRPALSTLASTLG